MVVKERKKWLDLISDAWFIVGLVCWHNKAWHVAKPVNPKELRWEKVEKKS